MERGYRWIYSRVVAIATALAVVDTSFWLVKEARLEDINDEHDHSSFQSHDGQILMNSIVIEKEGANERRYRRLRDEDG